MIDSTDKLTTATGLTKRQVERSLLALKRAARVEIQHRNHRFAPTQWSNRRLIYVKQEE